MTAESTVIPGCSVVDLAHHPDPRGEFVKVFQASAFPASGSQSVGLAAGAGLPIAELFWSRSHRGVVRGLHFQTPPCAHTKLVTIVAGTACDVVVDLRVGSPVFGAAATIALDASAPQAVVVPVGCAHGFQATADDTILLYAVTTEHAPEADAGIRWDSVGVTWPVADVVTSDRDAGFPTFSDFESPFVYEGPS